MTDRIYPTSQIVTAIVLQQMWRSCLSNRITFAEFKSKYSEEFIAERIAEIDAALALPSEALRALGHVRLHNQLLVLAKEGRRNWQSLKLYIDDFATNPVDEWTAAGWNDYEKASNDNFPALKNLLLKGSQYIADHTDELSANGNMPASFPTAYNAKMETIFSKPAAYYAEVEASRVATAFKVEQFNTCYAAGIKMGADGQHLFSENDEMRKLFSFEAVTEIVTPPGAAALGVDVTFNGMRKKGAEISIVDTDKKGTTDVHGEAVLTQLQQGAAVCKITCDGCKDQFINITLTAGTTSRIHAVMEPLFSGEMIVGSESSAGNHQLEASSS